MSFSLFLLPVVQLTWMAYDMVALRTSPALADSMRRLEVVYQRCRAAVRGNREPGEPEEGKWPESSARTLSQM